MSVLIDKRAVRIEEAAPKFDLPARVAPAVPGRADEPLEPLGDGYLGANSTQLAGALQRRYHGLKIKALYTGSTLEHAVAYDPKTGLAHDARGTFPTASSAFEGFGSNGTRGVARVENPPVPQDDDADADAYVARHWAPFENGGSSPLGGFQLDRSLDPGELDALIGGTPRPVRARTLDEARVLSEAIWNEKVHPRWPPGSHDAKGKKISGEFMRVGQRFEKDGHEWEIGHIAGNKIIAHEASGDVNKAQTVVFDTKTVGDVANALPGATPAKPRPLKGGFQPKLSDSTKAQIAKLQQAGDEMAAQKLIHKSTSGYSKTVIPDENSLVVDADRHEETHDPAIQPHPLSKLTPEQWSHFGRVDQLYYNSVMDHFGAWEINGKKPPPISSSGSQWSSKLQEITGQAPPDAVSTFQSEVSSLKGATHGNQMSGVRVFDGLLHDPVALANAQAKYARFREYEGDVNALLAWDLYNRLAAPDMTVVHRANAAEVFKKTLQGKASVLSGLSTSWKTGSWSEPHSFVFAMPVRQVAFFETLLGQGWGSGSGESELSNLDRLKVGQLAGFFQSHEIQQSGYGGSGSQAGKMFKWLTDKLNKDGAGGWLAGSLKKHFDSNDPYTVDLGTVDANFQLKKAAGAKTYFIPPDSVMADIEAKMAANPGHPEWEEQKKFADWPDGMKPKPGMIITKGGQQEGTRYLVIQNDALGPNEVQYVPLQTGSADYDVNPAGGGYKTPQAKVIVGDDGKPLFFPLPPPPKDRVWEHDMASLAPTGAALPVGSMAVGDKIAFNDDHWKITKKTGGTVSLQSLSDGSEGTVDSLWKTQQLQPTGVGGPTYKPEPGTPALLTSSNQLVNVESVDGEFAQVQFGNTASKKVAVSMLAAAPTLPKLTPQKGDTFTSAGQKYTVTHVLKDGTVNAKPVGGTVSHFPPDSPGLATLFRPGDYEPGPKQKLHAMAPGDLVSGSPAKVAPYQVLGTVGSKTHLKNLDTGEVVSFSKNVSYPTLVGKGAATPATPEVPGTVAHADWKPGDKVATEDLQVGDKINTGPGGADYTVAGQTTHQGEVGWQLVDASGDESWIPANLSTTGGWQATYLGKGEPPATPPPVSTVTAPGGLPDAVEHGDMAPYKWHKGGGGQVYPKLNSYKDGEHFTDKNGKLWKVKQGGTNPIVTDGHSLYTAPGKLHGKTAEPGTFTPISDATPEISPPLPEPPKPAESPYLQPNESNLSLKDLGLKPSDKFTYGGQTWVVDTLASGDTGNLSAHSEDMAAVKAFHGFAVPDSFAWMPTEPSAAPALPPFLKASTTFGNVPVTVHADSFQANDLAQRPDGSLVYLAPPSGDHWVEVGGGQVNIPADELLTPVNKAPSVPDTLEHSGESLDVHDIPAGQSFFAQGQPFLMLGHGPEGATAMNLKTGTILPAPAGQHGQFTLGTWSARMPPKPTVTGDSPLYSALADYESATPGQYGAWSIKKTTENGTGLFFHDKPVAWQASSGEHYVTSTPNETWPGSMLPQDMIEQIQLNHPGHHAVPQPVLDAIPLADAPLPAYDVGGQKVPVDVVHGAGADIPGPGVTLATSLVKGHHMKIKVDGTGAEYEVMETPKPGATSVPLKLLSGKQAGKVFDWKIYSADKKIMVTKAPEQAPAPDVPDLYPNDKSIGELGLGAGDYFYDSGVLFQIESTSKFNIQAKSVSGGATGNVSSVSKGFVPMQVAKPPEPEPTPSAPVADIDVGATFADLNVGDKYTFQGVGPGFGYEVVGKGPDTITIKNEHDGTTDTLPVANVFTSKAILTHKASPPAGGNAAGQLGPPTMAEMPITPYLWHKSGSKSYPAISDLAPGEQFTDKKGDKYTVYKHNVKQLADPVATTTVQGPSGGMIDIPQTFVNPKGKVNLTHVNKLSTVLPTATLPEPVEAGTADKAKWAATEFLIGAGHSPAEIEKLHSEAAGNVAAGKYPSTWAPFTKWSQAYADAYVDTYGEGASTIDMANSLFASVKAEAKNAPSSPPDSLSPYAEQVANALLTGDVMKKGDWHTELKGPPQHATMVLYHGTGDDALAVAYSDENGKLHVTPVKYKPSVDIGVQYLKDHDPGHIVAASGLDLDQEIEAASSPKPEPKTWADVRIGDLVKTQGGSSTAPFKVVGETSSSWKIESQHDGSKTQIPKGSTLPITVVGHEHVSPEGLPTPVNAKHEKAMRIADKWMKGQGMPADQIAQIHQNVATFYASNPEFPLGEAYATSITDKWNSGGLSGQKIDNPWKGLADPIKKATAGPAPKLVSPWELGVGDVFQNDNGGQFKVTDKHPNGEIEFVKLSGMGTSGGTMHPDSPVKYQLISKGEAPKPPTASASEIPLPQDANHEKAVNAADKWLLNIVPTSETANWIHKQAVAQKEQYPGFSWGEAYGSATHQALPDQTPDELNSLIDAVDATKGPLPGDEKLPQPASGTGSGIPDYTDFTNAGTELSITGSAGGTTGAQKAVDQQGKPWLIKSYASHPEAQDRVATELLANAVYRAMGHDAADAGVLNAADGKVKLAYPLKDGQIKQWSGKDEAKMKALGNGVMTDALVGNWDFAGLEDDNVLWNGDDPTRIDQGGTFMYRAQGKPKEFGPVPAEVNSLLTGGGQGAKGVSVSEAGLRSQAADIASKMTPEKIDQLVNAAPFADQAMKEKIRTNLKARVQWMSEFANGQHSDMLKGIKLAPDPAPKTPEPPPATTKLFDDEFWTPEHKQAFHAAHDWMVGKGLSHDTTIEVHKAAKSYNDAGVDWPTSYVYATGDKAAQQLDNQHAQISEPIEKALGGGPPAKPPGPATR